MMTICPGQFDFSVAGRWPPKDMFSVGGATLRDAAIAATGWDRHVLGLCYTEVGDTGETIGLVLRGFSENRALTLADAELLYARLYKMRRTADKVELLRQIFLRHRPETLKYFIKIVTGNLRIGLMSRTVEEAVAVATGTEQEEVRVASNRLGDLPRIAMAARRGTLSDIEARLFHPMDFMLARPLDALEDLPEPESWWVEDKYDGFRSQVHVEDGKVVIFTRGMEEVTASFSDVVETMRKVTGSAVIDGEILAWRDNRALAFTVLQQRIARKKMTAAVIEEIPVAFIAYDLLYRNGRMCLDLPIEQRRALLEECPLQLAPQWTAESTEAIEQSFASARERGNEGLLLKRKGSVYEPGKRSGSWYKVKRPYGTLDVVVTSAETGNGRRAIWLSDYTFAVKDGDRFLNVGKAYSGLTDAEIRELTKIFRTAALERYGRVTLVKPEVVLEVAFDGVQKSPRHKSGYALRFPRILHWRKDKGPEDADTLERVRELYEASLRA
ncbi:MAG: ATP-dependent DNA ligase [Bryobacteraceae bacterium]